jgi:Protein of unknown function (DUF1488)
MPLTFDANAPIWDSSREIVRFIGRDFGRVVQCGVSLAALKDHFKAFGRQGYEMLQIYRANADRIQRAADRKYRATVLGDLTDLVLVTTTDL